MTISSVLTQSCTHTLLQVHEDCNTGDYYTDTSLLRWCNRESHSRVLRGEGGGKGKEDARKRGTSPCTYKALASVYITYVVQFHDVSLQFRHDGFSTITRPYFSLSLPASPSRSFYHLPSSPFSLSSSLFSGFRGGAPLCEPRQIGNILSRNTAAVLDSTRRNILGDNGISGRTDSLLNIRFSVYTGCLHMLRRYIRLFVSVIK